MEGETFAMIGVVIILLAVIITGYKRYSFPKSDQEAIDQSDKEYAASLRDAQG